VLLLAITSPLLALGLLVLMAGYERWTLATTTPNRSSRTCPDVLDPPGRPDDVGVRDHVQSARHTEQDRVIHVTTSEHWCPARPRPRQRATSVARARSRAQHHPDCARRRATCDCRIHQPPPELAGTRPAPPWRNHDRRPATDRYGRAPVLRDSTSGVRRHRGGRGTSTRPGPASGGTRR
jgi:hypothetical protein